MPWQFEESMVGQQVRFGYLSKRAVDEGEAPRTIVGKVVQFFAKNWSAKVEQSIDGEIVTKVYNSTSNPDGSGLVTKDSQGRNLANPIEVLD